MNNTLFIDNFAFWTENDAETIPDVSFIPPMLRRRLSTLEKTAIAMAARVAPKSSDYKTVFASRFGEWNQTIKLIRQFYDDHEMSPAGFSNSVHNASMGHLSLLTHNKKSYTSVAGGERTIENALLDAMLNTEPVLFIYCEEKNPSEYEHILNPHVLSHGCAVFIDKNGTNRYELLKNDAEIPPLTFEKLKEFLKNGFELQTSNWKLLKK